MLDLSDEFDELEFRIQAGETDSAGAGRELRPDGAGSPAAWRRTQRRTRHGRMPERAWNPLASRRGRRWTIAAPRAEYRSATQAARKRGIRLEEHTSELQSPCNLV